MPAFYLIYVKVVELLAATLEREDTIKCTEQQTSAADQTVEELRRQLWTLQDKKRYWECCICLEQVALIPCGHIQVCEKCNEELYRRKDLRCPCCRTQIESWMKVYL